MRAKISNFQEINFEKISFIFGGGLPRFCGGILDERVQNPANKRG